MKKDVLNRAAHITQLHKWKDKFVKNNMEHLDGVFTFIDSKITSDLEVGRLYSMFYYKDLLYHDFTCKNTERFGILTLIISKLKEKGYYVYSGDIWSMSDLANNRGLYVSAHDVFGKNFADTIVG